MMIFPSNQNLEKINPPAVYIQLRPNLKIEMRANLFLDSYFGTKPFVLSCLEVISKFGLI